MKVTPFETYQTYLSIKNHFSSPRYDYFKYGGRSRAKITAFNKRKDKYWFEKTSRKYPDKDIVDFLVSNFVTANNPSSLWIGEIINSGERTYSEWSRNQQSLSYIFKVIIPWTGEMIFDRKICLVGFKGCHFHRQFLHFLIL